jgi:Mn2+/Fe2+ NRAMP family transporter
LREAPAFYWLYTILIAIGAGVILTPNIPLIKVMFWSQVINGVMLPFVFIFMLYLINNKDIMGEYVNNWTYNIISWVTVATMIAFPLLMVVTSFFQS